jgi:G6PDH family F420-dependent oxidoreductase
MNEHVTGDPWPSKELRQQRLEECVDIIRRLHRGGEVTHHGLVTVEQARIWDAPEPPPPLIAPAISVETARRAAGWADGLVTVNQPPEKLKHMLAAYRDNGGQGKAILQVHLSWATREEDAVAVALDQWRTNTFAPPVPWDLPTAAHFDGVSNHIGEEQVRKSVNISASLDRHAEWLAGYIGLGFDELYLHFVGQDQAAFIDEFGAGVLPHLGRGSAAESPVQEATL